MNNYEILFIEFLELIEFELVKTPDGWQLIDLTGANLANIEEEIFNSATQIIDRLDNYTYDYIVSSIEEQLAQKGVYCQLYGDFTKALAYKELFNEDEQWDFDIVDMICNHPEEINLNNLEGE